MVKNGLRPAVFLDRDGVLNRSDVREGKPYAPRLLQNFRLLPGTASAVQTLRDAGYYIAVVTNQPDIGNQLVDPNEVAAMHDRLRQRVPIDDLRVCPHSQNAGCLCRKPKPGMLLDIAQQAGIDLSKSFMIGDRSGDIVAGQAAGCYTIFIQRHYKEPLTVQPDMQVGTLPAAVAHILSLHRVIAEQ